MSRQARAHWLPRPHWLTRRRLWIAVTLAVVIASWPYAEHRATRASRQIRIVATVPSTPDPDGDSAQAAIDAPVRILTYNIAHGRGCTESNWSESGEPKQLRIAQIASEIRDLHVDLVVLNEVDFESSWSGNHNQAADLAALAEFPYRVEQRNFDARWWLGRWQFGNALLSRFPILDCRLVELPRLSIWEDVLAGSKQAFLATIQRNPDQQIDVLVVHLEPRSEAIRVASVQQILDLQQARRRSLIIAGDFNSTPRPLPHAQLDPQGRNAIEILQQAESLRTFEPASGLLPTFPADAPRRTIDWIMIPQPWNFLEYRVPDWQWSDHRPVFASVSLAP